MPRAAWWPARRPKTRASVRPPPEWVNGPHTVPAPPAAYRPGTAQLGDPGPQVVEPGDVRLRHGAVGLAEEESLHVPDCLRAADVPQEAAGEQGVPAAVAAFLHDQDAGAGVVGGDGRAGPGRAAPDDQDVNVHTVSLPSRAA
jgi:hypothetical protein